MPLEKFAQMIQREILDVIVHVWPLWQWIDFALSFKVNRNVFFNLSKYSCVLCMHCVAFTEAVL